MKIGLEFEGVIRSSRTGDICRWPKIPEESRKLIKRMIYERREKVEPIDGYDCLAEVRTLPLENPSPYELINALFTEMELASKAFFAAGYGIQWFEQEIPKAIHDEVVAGANLRDPDGKKRKPTHTFGDGGIKLYQSEGNYFRGGGLHINISNVPRELAPSLVLHLDDKMYRDRVNAHYKHKSHYRTNLLFRMRAVQRERLKTLRVGSSTETWDTICEYMSFGFNVPKLEGWREAFDATQKETCWGEQDPWVYWPVRLVSALNEWTTKLKEVR
jgi:hypothetical protein